MRHTLRSLRHRNFRLYYAGQLVSLTGTWMQNLAQAWLVYRLTGSAFMLGLVSAATLLPSLLLAFVGGWLADHLPRKPILIGVQLLTLMQALGLALLAWLGLIEAWHVLVMALLLGIVQAIELPVRHSFVAALVPRTDLPNAIALNASLFQGSRLVGPAIAGLLIGVIGEAGLFLMNAVSYLAVLAVLLMIRLPSAAAAHADTASKHWREGIRYARRHPAVGAALGMVAAVSLFGSAVAVLLPVFAVEVLHVGADRLGFLMSAIGAGALVGAIRLAARRSHDDQARVIAAAGVGTGLAVIGFSVSTVFLLSLVCLALVGFCMITVMASSNARLQLAAPDSLRGRVMALFTMALHGMLPIGSLMVGAGADVVGAPLTALVAGAALVAAALWLGRPLRAAGDGPGRSL